MFRSRESKHYAVMTKTPSREGVLKPNLNLISMELTAKHSNYCQLHNARNYCLRPWMPYHRILKRCIQPCISRFPIWHQLRIDKDCRCNCIPSDKNIRWQECWLDQWAN